MLKDIPHCPCSRFRMDRRKRHIEAVPRNCPHWRPLPTRYRALTSQDRPATARYPTPRVTRGMCVYHCRSAAHFEQGPASCQLRESWRKQAHKDRRKADYGLPDAPRSAKNELHLISAAAPPTTPPPNPRSRRPWDADYGLHSVLQSSWITIVRLSLQLVQHREEPFGQVAKIAEDFAGFLLLA